jgi:cell filamentation protein
MTPKSLRYHAAAGPEASGQPGSHGRVLANLKGITSKRAIDLLEYQALVAAQERYYSVLTAETRFTSSMLRQMHADWLGELYVWAGKYRTVELQKDNFSWPPAYRVAENMATFERSLLTRLTPCRPGP